MLVHRLSGQQSLHCCVMTAINLLAQVIELQPNDNDVIIP